jgi:hypothetical protein
MQLHKGSHLGKRLIQDGAIEFDIADLALAIEKIRVYLLFAKVNDELPRVVLIYIKWRRVS